MMRHEPNVHVARFGKQRCEIEVGVGCSAHGPLLMFVAEAFVRDERFDALRPIVRGTGETVTIHAETEAHALNGMLRVLEHHFGPVTDFSEAHDRALSRGEPWPLPVPPSRFLDRSTWRSRDRARSTVGGWAGEAGC